jgi:chromosome segregation ATPase
MTRPATTDQPVATSATPSASEHVVDPTVAELERINAEADDLARHLRPDPVAVSTLKRDLSKIRMHIDSVDDARRRARLALLASRARRRLLNLEARIASLSERDQRPGTIHPPPSDRDFHRRIGPTQQYDDET